MSAFGSTTYGVEEINGRFQPMRNGKPHFQSYADYWAAVAACEAAVACRLKHFMHNRRADVPRGIAA